MTTENQIIDPAIKELMESAATGEAAKLFLQSELGRYVAGRAADDVEESIAKLIEADPGNAQLILKLQTEINVAKQAIVYLTEAMTEGDNAMRQLHSEF